MLSTLYSMPYILYTVYSIVVGCKTDGGWQFVMDLIGMAVPSTWWWWWRRRRRRGGKVVVGNREKNVGWMVNEWMFLSSLSLSLSFTFWEEMKLVKLCKEQHMKFVMYIYLEDGLGWVWLGLGGMPSSSSSPFSFSLDRRCTLYSYSHRHEYSWSRRQEKRKREREEEWGEREGKDEEKVQDHHSHRQTEALTD